MKPLDLRLSPKRDKWLAKAISLRNEVIFAILFSFSSNFTGKVIKFRKSFWFFKSKFLWIFLFLSFPAIFIYWLDRHDVNLSGTRQFQALDRIYNSDTPVTLRLYWKPLILPMKIIRPLISTMQVLDKSRTRFGYDTQMHIHI